LDCAVQVTAGKAGTMRASAPRARNRAMFGMSGPISEPVSPTTLITAKRDGTGVLSLFRAGAQ
jgi:hypothetical protein